MRGALSSNTSPTFLSNCGIESKTFRRASMFVLPVPLFASHQHAALAIRIAQITLRSTILKRHLTASTTPCLCFA